MNTQTQFELFDLTEGTPVELRTPKKRKRTAKQARDAAIAKVAKHALPQFLFAADKAIRKTARDHHEFIVDDVWKNMPAVRTEDNRAMGAAIRRAVREGVIYATHQFRISEQPQCHANPRRVWASLIYRG